MIALIVFAIDLVVLELHFRILPFVLVAVPLENFTLPLTNGVQRGPGGLTVIAGFGESTFLGTADGVRKASLLADLFEQPTTHRLAERHREKSERVAIFVTYGQPM